MDDSLPLIKKIKRQISWTCYFLFHPVCSLADECCKILYPSLKSGSSSSYRSHDSLQSTTPNELRRRKSQTEVKRQLSRQKSIIPKPDEEMPPQNKNTLIQDEKAEVGVVSSVL